MKIDEKTLCDKQKNNFGICCEHRICDDCNTCGWNPEVAKERHKRLLKKYSVQEYIT